MNDGTELYLDLLRDCLTRSIFPESWREVSYDKGSFARVVAAPLFSLLRLKGYYLCKRYDFSRERRSIGTDWPPEAETMVGLKRLTNVRECCTQAVKDGIPGDFCETGVWRGGTCIYMRGILKAYGDNSRAVWVCDSFQGLPKSTHKEDLKWNFWKHEALAVDVEHVKANFERYGLLDENVRFVVGWFKDSLPSAPIGQLSVLRLDGDLYESTWDAITNLYPKLSRGGYLIVDDYGGIDSCKKAIDDYRREHAISDPIQTVDKTGVYWRRT